MRWYLWENTKKSGPFTVEELHKKLREGELSLDSIVVKEGSNLKRKIIEVGEIIRLTGEIKKNEAKDKTIVSRFNTAQESSLEQPETLEKAYEKYFSLDDTEKPSASEKPSAAAKKIETTSDKTPQTRKEDPPQKVIINLNLGNKVIQEKLPQEVSALKNLPPTVAEENSKKTPPAKPENQETKEKSKKKDFKDRSAGKQKNINKNPKNGSPSKHSEKEKPSLLSLPSRIDLDAVLNKISHDNLRVGLVATIVTLVFISIMILVIRGKIIHKQKDSSNVGKITTEEYSFSEAKIKPSESKKARPLTAPPTPFAPNPLPILKKTPVTQNTSIPADWPYLVNTFEDLQTVQKGIQISLQNVRVGRVMPNCAPCRITATMSDGGRLMLVSQNASMWTNAKVFSNSKISIKGIITRHATHEIWFIVQGIIK